MKRVVSIRHKRYVSIWKALVEVCEDTFVECWDRRELLGVALCSYEHVEVTALECIAQECDQC